MPVSNRHEREKVKSDPLIAYQVSARKLFDIGYFVNVVPGWCQA
jgi:hypothetical protein